MVTTFSSHWYFSSFSFILDWFKNCNLWYFKQNARRFKTHQNTCGFRVNWNTCQKFHLLPRRLGPYFICKPHEFEILHETYPNVRACLECICRQHFRGLRMTHQRVLTRLHACGKKLHGAFSEGFLVYALFLSSLLSSNSIKLIQTTKHFFTTSCI